MKDETRQLELDMGSSIVNNEKIVSVEKGKIDSKFKIVSLGDIAKGHLEK
jgi:hypothetical protein